MAILYAKFTLKALNCGKEIATLFLNFGTFLLDYGILNIKKQCIVLFLSTFFFAQRIYTKILKKDHILGLQRYLDNLRQSN